MVSSSGHWELGIATVFTALSCAWSCLTVLSSYGLHFSVSSLVGMQWLGFPISRNVVLPPA